MSKCHMNSGAPVIPERQALKALHPGDSAFDEEAVLAIAVTASDAAANAIAGGTQTQNGRRKVIPPTTRNYTTDAMLHPVFRAG